MLSKIRTVLIHNSHPGNIGSSARALKNMGLSALYLVSPKTFPSKEALYMASRADEIVENAIVVQTAEEAIKECGLIFGASARQRSLARIEKTPREAAALMAEALNNNVENIAILYGCEQNGLSNMELDLAHYQIVIPAMPQYASLNVAQAVQLISYEIYLAHLENEPKIEPLITQAADAKTTDEQLANQEEVENFYDHLETILLKVQFVEKEKPGLLLSRLRRLFGRAQLKRNEVNILRGILTAIGKRV